MKRWFVALACLLSLALPLQGLAAASPFLAFGAMHDTAPAGAELHPCHAEAPASTDGSPAPAGCAQCAVCHAGGAPVPHLLLVAQARPGANTPPTWQPPFLAAVDPDGFDRPPRRHLA